MAVKKVYITWEEVNSLLDIIYSKVGNKFKYVTGIPRGGAILAALYSHRFKVEYNHGANVDPDQLIIDDIADSGGTLELWKNSFPTCTFATLHYKNISKANCNFDLSFKHFKLVILTILLFFFI